MLYGYPMLLKGPFRLNHCIMHRIGSDNEYVSLDLLLLSDLVEEQLDQGLHNFLSTFHLSFLRHILILAKFC